MNEVVPSSEGFRGPNEREILNVVEELFGADKNLKEINRVEDDDSISRLVFETQESDGADKIQIDFFQNTIDVIYFDAEGIPSGGKSVTVYDNNKWEILD